MGVLSIVVAAVAVGAVAGSAIAVGDADSSSLKTHRVVLSRSWTPAVLTKITDRVDPYRGISVKAVYRSHVPPGNPKGWWFVWNDPTRNSQIEGMRDYWTAQLVGRLYQDRRKLSAPKLSGIQLKTRVAGSSTDWVAGENSHFWARRASAYLQARPAAFRAHIQREAAERGLKLVSFRAPRLDGILAPIVAVQVSDKARFDRWYDPGCLAGWIFGPVKPGPDGSDGQTPYYAGFLTFTYASGAWLESESFVPNEGESQESDRAAKQSRKLAGSPGIRACHELPPSAG